ncbi:cytochrome P450 [Nocardia sp. 348MFTsu5.1]|uniref:cytochrome P450 n=1 Tax=Nocardia sp. 348MFTsu5.1 TaxID=1172185 RepID=UPI0003725370|nr:cytochrome P450 [Nocardia sp. 348MFTsu5.1]
MTPSLVPSRVTITGVCQRAAAHVASLYPSPVQPLAVPASGSDLKPVMGSYGLPVLGHVLESVAQPLDFGRERYRRHGPVSWTGALGFRVVTVTGPDALQEVWLDKKKVFSSEIGWKPIIGPFFHRGLMLLDFDEHLFHRRIMQQAFTRPRLDGYLALTRPLVSETLSTWTPGDKVLLYDRTKALLLTMASQVFIGESPEGETARQLSHAFDDAVLGAQAVIRHPGVPGRWSRGLRGRRFLEGYFRAAIPRRREGAGEDLFTVLCQSQTDEGSTFTDEDIVNHMIFLLMAAHDTSTIALSMLMYHLGKDPELQQRLRAEVRALPDAASIDDLNSAQLLDNAFKESLRMYAPAGTLFRQSTADTSIQGHFIPAGTEIALNVHTSMRLDSWWNHPDMFDPNRFDDPETRAQMHRYAWSPFGAGAHKCIGMHFAGLTVKAILHRILIDFEWTVPSSYTPVMAWGTGPTPADGLPVRLRRIA